MGKTLMFVIAGVALAATGIGLVAGAPGLASAFGFGMSTLGISGLAASVGIGLGTIATISATAVLASASSLLGLGPSLPKPETSETAIKVARPPRVSAYGRSRLWGAYALYETATNGTAVDVYAVHHGKIDGIERYYLGDDEVTLSGNTVNPGADGRYKGGAVNLYTTDGSTPGAGFPAVTALIPSWNGRGDGVVALALTAASVKAKDFQEVFPQSTVPVPSIVARWQRCPDLSAGDPLDETGWTWTESPVRQLLHYKLVREGPRPALPQSDPGYASELAALRAAWWDHKIAPTLSYWIAAENDCNAARTLKAGGTEPKYRSCVQHKHTDQHQGVIGALLATFDGWIAPRTDGALVVYSGVAYAPTVSIGPDEIVSYSWDGGGVDDDSAVNEIICSYVSAAHDYTTPECDAWRDEGDITARGQVLSAPLEAQVPSHAQARYLAKRRMARRNARNRGTVTTNIAGRSARGQRYINLHIEEAGTTFFSGIAEITKLTRMPLGGVSFEWVEFNPDVDAWNPATEEGDPAANGTRVAPEPLDTPEITAATVDDDSRLHLTVSGPDRIDLTWYVHWRVVGAPVWGPDEEYSDTDPGPAVELATNVIPTEGNIEVEVAYAVGDGRVSAWSVVEVITVGEVIYDGGEP